MSSSGTTSPRRGRCWTSSNRSNTSAASTAAAWPTPTTSKSSPCNYCKSTVSTRRTLACGLRGSDRGGGMATGPTGGFVFRPGEGRRIDLGGFTMSVKASELETDGQFTLLEAGEPPGFGVGSVQSRKLNLYVPGAMTSYFDQLSAALQRGEADEVALAAIAEKNSVESLDPDPEGYI